MATRAEKAAKRAKPIADSKSIKDDAAAIASSARRRRQLRAASGVAPKPYATEAGLN